MGSSADLQSARDHLAAGHLRRCVTAAWRAADAALTEGDRESLRSVMALADELRLNDVARVAKDGERLASYCRHTLDGAGGGVESHALLARISRIGKPRRACPDCGEKIPNQARVCRYCGYRLAPQ